jgi:magnesium transporter
MARRRKRRSPPGSPPGTLTPDPAAAPPHISAICYGPDGVEEQKVLDLEALPGLLGRWPVTWVNVDGIGHVDTIRRLGEIFNLHRLALEDVANLHQRPKVDTYDSFDFIVTRMPAAGEEFQTEQISIFLGRNYVLTFQEELPGDCFGAIRDRLRHEAARIRQAGPDYLAYSLLDAVIDAYFPVLEDFGELVEELEDRVLEDPGGDLVQRIHAVKRDLLAVRRTIWPQREMINTLIRHETPFVTDRTRIYLRDCYDHTIQLIDMVETYREIASSLVDIYLSGLSARMNEVMKVLTIIATIFIPLGFIASVYGMNFDTSISPWNMPELAWFLGYPYALALMTAVALVLVAYFWRQGWIGRPRKRRRR